MIVVTIGELAGLALALLAVVVMLALQLRRSWTQAKCPHDEGFNEDRSCTAWCHACGKNMGFIGDVRRNQEKSHD